MISVKLNTALSLKKIIGKKEVEISLPEGCVLREFIEKIVSIWGKELSSSILDPEDSSVLPHIRVMVNGQDSRFLNDLETELHEGDSVTILPPTIGG